MICFAISLFLIKSIIKAVLAAVIIAVFFRVLWIYNPEQMIETLRLEKIMSEEQLERVRSGYEDFTQKRNDFILDPESIDNYAEDILQEQINDRINPPDSDVEN